MKTREQLHAESCSRKLKFGNKAAAKRKDVRVYKCLHCNNFHQTKGKNNFVTRDANPITGVALRGLRLKHNLSQKTLAARLGLKSHNVIKRIEAGKQGISENIERKLRGFFGKEYVEYVGKKWEAGQ